jgi:Adenylate cyclase, family 3 (some proteins contain HAMP domain)
MKITTAFTKQFELETLQSEKLRAAILASYALFTGVYILVINYLIKSDTGKTVEGFKLPHSLLFLLAGLFFYELGTNRLLNYRTRKFQRSIHPNFKYVNAFIELATITVMLYVYTVYFKNNSLLSDVVMVSLYYLIVFLSAFYLDRYICIVTGIIASSGYTLLHILSHKVSIVDEEILYNKYFVYATGVLLFLCGIAAAFMANQLKKGIERTVELVEDENKLFNLFSRQISKEVAQELLDKDGKVPSQLKFVSVMFIDIRDFTVYAETQQPEAIVQFQNIFFGIITGVVHKYGGIVNQFLGDGCMITFGAPVNVDNPSANAVNAALEINKLIDDKIEKKELHPFKIGIGIHCGQAVTGNIGTMLKSEYSITGGVVILAARIESENKTYGSKILVSKDALDACCINDINAIAMGASHLKGWSHPVELYKLA